MKIDSVIKRIGDFIGWCLIVFVLIALVLAATLYWVWQYLWVFRLAWFFVLVFSWAVAWPFIVYYRVGALYWVWIGLGWLAVLVGVVMGLKNGFFTRCRERLGKKNRTAMSTPENDS